MITPQSVLKDLDVALKQFGTYNYYDKGVDEVFDASQAVAHVRTLPAPEAITFLVTLSKHEHGEHLAQHIGVCLDDTDEEWFEKVVEGCEEVGLNVY